LCAYLFHFILYAMTKVLFVWDYNLPILYNLTYFKLTLSSKQVRLYNLGRLESQNKQALTLVILHNTNLYGDHAAENLLISRSDI
jgi:hypothetical protein